MACKEKKKGIPFDKCQSAELAFCRFFHLLENIDHDVN